MAERRGEVGSGPKPKLMLKLLVDRLSRRVLFAEAGKEVVDFLLGMLFLPVNSITRLLTPDAMVGSLGKLYASLQSLDDTYLIHPAKDRTALLNPKLPSPTRIPQTTTTTTLQNEPAPAAKVYYRCSAAVCTQREASYSVTPGVFSQRSPGPHTGCSGDYRHVTDVSGTACPSCGKAMTLAMGFVAGAGDTMAQKARAVAGEGFVKSVVTYMVMDDLAVKPMSTISAIALLNKFHVSSLYEWTVELGMEEGLELLKASLQSETVLTDVFVKKSKKGAPVE